MLVMVAARAWEVFVMKRDKVGMKFGVLSVERNERLVVRRE